MRFSNILFFLNRHRQAPLLKERESFLNHLQQQGTSRKALRNLSGELLQVVRLLKLTEMRDVSLEEIQRAARCWARQQRTNPKAHSHGNSASSFWGCTRLSILRLTDGEKRVLLSVHGMRQRERLLHKLMNGRIFRRQDAYLIPAHTPSLQLLTSSSTCECSVEKRNGI